MSLWDKWEREKQERMGIKVERKSDVDIRDTRAKHNVHKQTWAVVGAVLACCLVVYFALVLNAMYGGDWSDTLIVRMFVGRQEQRMATANSQ